MPKVDTSVLIDAPMEIVYRVARDNSEFPDFMDDVDSLTVLSDEGGVVVSEWVGRVPAFGLKIKWTQQDTWNEETKVCQFEQLKGDYDKMIGEWRLTEEGDGVRFDSTLEYEYVVPGLGPLVGRVIYGLVVKNMEEVLGAIKKRAEERA